MSNLNIENIFQAHNGRASVWTDHSVFFDQVANAPFRRESFNEVLEILREAGFKFKKDYPTLDEEIQNVWVYDVQTNDLPEPAIEAVIRAAAACGIRYNEVLLGIRESQIVKRLGLDKIEVKRSEKQKIQIKKLLDDAAKI